MKPRIRLQQIGDLASRQSYSRSESYYQRGAIINLISRGNRLEGRCKGSGYSPYLVSVVLEDDGNVEDASCTCDYDYDGVCKHVVALLLTYLQRVRDLYRQIDGEQSWRELITAIRDRFPKLRALQKELRNAGL